MRTFEMSDDEVKAIIPHIRVIARALPKDKSRMVKLAQELNLVCGMTGDGVNDSPALKRADVGFAMGSGTEAAKEAGDLIIIDDNFFSIRNLNIIIISCSTDRFSIIINWCSSWSFSRCCYRCRCWFQGYPYW